MASVKVNHRPRGRGGYRQRRGLLGDLGALSSAVLPNKGADAGSTTEGETESCAPNAGAPPAGAKRVARDRDPNKGCASNEGAPFRPAVSTAAAAAATTLGEADQAGVLDLGPLVPKIDAGSMGGACAPHVRAPLGGASTAVAATPGATSPTWAQSPAPKAPKGCTAPFAFRYPSMTEGSFSFQSDGKKAGSRLSLDATIRRRRGMSARKKAVFPEPFARCTLVKVASDMSLRRPCSSSSVRPRATATWPTSPGGASDPCKMLSTTARAWR